MTIVRSDHRHSAIPIFALALAATVLPAPRAAAQDAPCDDGGFTHAPFVSPRIVQDLETWISDGGEQVVAINLTESADTNRYFGDFRAQSPDGGGAPTVRYEDADACAGRSCPFGPPYFSYRLVGTTPQGVSVLHTADGGDGSGVFESLLLVAIAQEDGFVFDEDAQRLSADRRRCVIRRLTQIPLGDRYGGAVTLDGDMLHIGAHAAARGGARFPEDVRITVPAPPAGAVSTPADSKD